MKYIFSIIFFIGISVAVPVHVLAADIPPASLPVSANKRIDVDLSEQRLRYYHGDYEMGSFLISSGTKWYPTPVGEFAVQKKLPLVWYYGRNGNGTYYNYPRTKWNLMFLPHYYIHGAYWHNKFGRPMSHGCVNVSYQDMERLYIWAEQGTPVTIHE